MQGVTRLACLRHSPVAVTACLDGAVRCWDIRTGAPRGPRDLANTPVPWPLPGLQKLPLGVHRDSAAPGLLTP